MPEDTPRGSVPVPDPTVLTTQAVDRALAAYREVVTEQIRNLETRLHGMDRATDLLAEELVKITDQTAEKCEAIRRDSRSVELALRESYTLQIENVRDVLLEKSSAHDTQFKERDTRVEQTDRERKTSLDAALAAQKEAAAEQQKANALAIGKSEDATKERLDSQQVLMNTSIASLGAQIADLKGRLDRGEGLERGTTESRQRSQLQSNWSIGLLLSAALSALGAAVAIVLALTHR